MSIARFLHISAKQYAADAASFAAMPLKDIPLPVRATAGSAGYDFVCPVEVELLPGQQVTIPTGIRVPMEQGWVLVVCPRSSLGRKHNIRLANTIGIIDSDYAHADNEGHILISLVNGGDHSIILHPGDRFCQGIFLSHGLAEEDAVTGDRSGGFGSTGT